MIYRSDEPHECGGRILAGESLDGSPDAPTYFYCDACGAFLWTDAPGWFPTGTDRLRNRAAWDDGELRSPDAPEDPPDPDGEGPLVPTGGA